MYANKCVLHTFAAYIGLFALFINSLAQGHYHTILCDYWAWVNKGHAYCQDMDPRSTASLLPSPEDATPSRYTRGVLSWAASGPRTLVKFSLKWLYLTQNIPLRSSMPPLMNSTLQLLPPLVFIVGLSALYDPAYMGYNTNFIFIAENNYFYVKILFSKPPLFLSTLST